MINKRFPLVLMLEPLHACNLTCTGCGRIREYENDHQASALSLEECLEAVGRVRRADRLDLRRRADDLPGDRRAGGGDPRARQAHLSSAPTACSSRSGCTSSSRTSASSSTSTWTAWRRTTTSRSSAKACSSEAIEGIKAAKEAGFLVCTNTTVYKETDMNEIEELFEYLEQFGVDGYKISPAYGYSAVNDREIFMTRDDIHEKFQDIDQHREAVPRESDARLPGVPAGRARAALHRLGQSDLQRQGLEGPVLPDHRRHHKTFDDLMTKTPWENYGPGNDPRCEHCMVHCGFEPSAALGINAKLGGQLQDAELGAALTLC